MKQYVTLFILSILALRCVGSELSSHNVMERSDLWPFRVALSEDRELDRGTVLKAGRTAVLIRVEKTGEDGEVAICDYGGDGIHRIDVESTDLVERMRRIRAEPASKDLANYVEMMANKFRLPDGSGEFISPPLPFYKEKRGFLFVYIDREESYESLAGRLAEVAPMIDEKKVIPLVLPVFPYVDSEFGPKILDLEMDVGIFPAFLCYPFIRTLQHEPGSESMLVLTDMDGRILYREKGLDFEEALGGRVQPAKE